MGKKNAQIHFVIETSLKEVLQKEAEIENVTLAEICREKLRQNSRFVRIELMLEEINKKLLENE